MPRKRHSPEQILGKLREVEVALAKGQTVARAVKQIGVTEQTHSTSLRAGSTTVGVTSTVVSPSIRLKSSSSWNWRMQGSNGRSPISHWTS